MKTIKKSAGLTTCFVVLVLTLALGGFQLYRSTVNFSSALRRAAEELEREFKNLQIEEYRLKELEAKKEKLSQVPIIDVSKTMPADELREFLLKFFEQDVIDVQEISLQCEVTEPVVFDNIIPNFVVMVRSGLTAASPELRGNPDQTGQEQGGQVETNTDGISLQLPGGTATSQDLGGTSVGGQ